MMETMQGAMYLEIAKHLWWGIVLVTSVYLITDMIRINKARELKAEIKMRKDEKED